MKRRISLWLVLALLLTLVGCRSTAQTNTPIPTESVPALTLATDTPAPVATPTPAPTPEPTTQPTPEPDLPVEGEYYYDLENVVLYLELYHELPGNYISKTKARNLGWEGGSVEPYYPGGAIGGSRFGNLEGLLPESNGRSYTECDLNTNGKKSRGAERLVFSNDGLYFYTGDHYESFTEYVVTENWEVVPK